MGIGAAIGGLTGAGLLLPFMIAYGCEDAPCVGLLLTGAGLGVASGAIVGAFIDSIRERRRTIYESSGSTLNVVPTLARRGGGVRVAIVW